MRIRQSTLLRFFFIGILFALGLGGGTFFALRSINESSTHELRRHIVMFIVQTIEAGPFIQTIEDYHFRSAKRYMGSNLWVYSENGQILATNADHFPTIPFEKLKKPTSVHDFSLYYDPLRLLPSLILVKLDAAEPLYLLIEFKRHHSFVSAMWVEMAFFLFVIGVGLIMAFGLTYFYLSKKSIEARWVLARLEKGDLKARFEIKRLDEIGSLMIDFNRMASEIERLVHRIQETETTRKHLLEELSHDIRTPLTSLKTSIETLAEHLEQMPIEEQREFLAVSRAELDYFLNLIDDLFFIADLEEPRYKKTTQKFNLSYLISDEVKTRQAQEKMVCTKEDKKLRWELNCADPETFILGDPLLIQRLFKNAFDNMAKHAKSFIAIHVRPSKDFINIVIEDDGAGISPEAIAYFGKRKKQRTKNFSLQWEETKNGINEMNGTKRKPSLSLGLGSAIMKTILELHGGTFKIENQTNTEKKAHGTQLVLCLPR